MRMNPGEQIITFVFEEFVFKPTRSNSPTRTSNACWSGIVFLLLFGILYTRLARRENNTIKAM